MTMRDSIAAARISGPQSEGDGAAVFEFRFAADDATFQGHFPSRPLVPGVFQLEMARAAAEWMLNCPLAIREVGKAKFLRPIRPDEIVRLTMKLSPNDHTIQARAGFSVEGQPAGESWLSLWRTE